MHTARRALTHGQTCRRQQEPAWLLVARPPSARPDPGTLRAGRDPAIVEATVPDNPANVERRDFLQVEKDAWAARKRIGDIPVTILTVEVSAAAINESPFPSERRAMRRNVERQRRWLALSPR